MTAKGVLLLANNDSLETVIKKCNANFQAVLTQQSQSKSLATQAQEVFAGEVTEEIAESVGEAVDSLTEAIQSEASARSLKDQDLENAIETVDGKFSDYTKTEDLATVATSGDYSDLSNVPDLSIYAKSSDLATVAMSGSYTDLSDQPMIPTVPTIPINGAYLTFGTENPSTVHGGTWTQVGTISVGAETLKAWKKTAL